MTTLIITDKNDKQYTFNIDEDEYEDAIEMALLNNGCKCISCDECPFNEEADNDPTFKHFCEHVIGDVEWKNIKKVEELVVKDRKIVNKLTINKIKEEMKNGEVTLLGNDKEYRLVGFSYLGEVVLQDMSGMAIFTCVEKYIQDFKIKGLEPKIVKFLRHYYSKPSEIGWHFYTSEITGMVWEKWVRLQSEEDKDKDKDKETWKLLETEVVKEIEVKI